MDFYKENHHVEKVSNCLTTMLDPHTHFDVINYLTEEGIIIMSHLLYSPDLAPCDYWLNDDIKRNLTDQPNEKSFGLVRYPR